MPGEPRRGTSLLGVLASSTLASLAVVVLVGVLILAFGHNSAEEAAQTAAAETELVGPLPASPLPPEPTATPVPTPTPTATPTLTPTPTPAVAKVPVVVLNQTTTTGLAARFERELEAAGWTVAGIDDFRGNVPATTVYFPPGLRAAAKALMAQFPEVGRIRPAFPGIPTTQLTVILCRDFPTSA